MSSAAPGATGHTARVLRNTSMLMGAQVLAMPLAILVNALMARSLGPAQYGSFYQAGVFAAFVFLLAEWGQSSVLTRVVATGRERAGEYLGSGIASRLAGGAVVGLPLLATVYFAGYGGNFVMVLALMLAAGMCGTVAGACQDVFRGFERTDFAAFSMVGWQLLAAAVVVPVLLAGGGLVPVLAAQLACAFAGTVFVVLMAPRLGVRHLAVRPQLMLELWQRGHPFFIFSLVLAIQPFIEAAMLSRLVTAEAMGWFGVAKKLAGVLSFPASALLAALYPTLCRLHLQDPPAFLRTTRDALMLVAVVALPLCLGCAFHPGLGVAIFGREDYAPAEDILRVMAATLFLVYFSMPMGSCLTAGGRQRAWTVVLLAGVLTSVALNLVLIQWFQARTGNGGLGVAVSALCGEVITVTGAALLLPSGTWREIAWRHWAAVGGCGALMVATLLATRGWNPWLGAAASGLAYLAGLQLTGLVNLRQPRALLARLRS